MNSCKSPWLRLVATARMVPADTREAVAPHGFATRVVALAFATSEFSMMSLFARLSWRALAVAAVVMLVSVVANFKPMLTSFDRDASMVLVDPVGEWLDIS